MVMSPGIVSLALGHLGCHWGAMLFFAINICMYAVLWPLYILKLFVYPDRMRADFTGHLTGPGFLTIVAGTSVLGAQFAILGQSLAIAQIFFWLACLLWIAILWGTFFCIFINPVKPSLEHGINGSWLLATVSTQSIVVLGATIARGAGWSLDVAFFLLCAMFGLGLILYILIITLIFYRFCFAELRPEGLDPAFWINTSAVAITTLAGATLIIHGGDAAMPARLRPFIEGITLLAWATASWWLPFLFLLGIWRHLLRKLAFAYTPAFWGMVFPMGMYTTCTAALAKAIDFPKLMIVPRIFIWIALLAWLATFTGMIRADGGILLHGRGRHGQHRH